MKLLIDENLPRSMVERLREAGHDVAYVADDWSGLRDSDVLALARDEDRILITFDRDFGELVFRHRLPPPSSIVYLRRRGSSTRSVVATTIALLLDVNAETLDGRFVVVTGEDIRHRPLPSP